MSLKKLFLILLFVTVSNSIATAQAKGSDIAKAPDAKNLIETLNKSLFDNYIFPDKSALIATHLNAQLKKGKYKKITDPRHLAAAIADDIRTIHVDRHLRVQYDPDFAKELSGPQNDGPRFDLDSAELVNAQNENFSFKKVEILPGNIGYVKFNGFPGFVVLAKPTITSAFRFVSKTNAIILDLRKNGGGSPGMVRLIASYFVKEKTRLNDIYERAGDKTIAFWADPEMAEKMNLSMPLYILTSKETFSAAEDFTYAMQVNKRAVIVGDTTGGGAHPTRSFPIGQGFIADIPFARSINHITLTDWEGTGVRPDVPVKADDALVKAQELILKSQLSEKHSERDLRKIQWAMNALNTNREQKTRDPKELLLLVGDYTPFRISMKENQLYLHDPPGRTFLLKPISDTLFSADDWLQLELIKKDGKVSQLKLMGSPGWVDFYDRTN